jgi:phosphoglycolate phosphatase
MLPIIARYGYLGTDDRPEQWGAQGTIEHPAELLRFL